MNGPTANENEAASPASIRIAHSAGYEVSKRALDICVAAAGIIGLLPLLLLIAIAVRLDSPGPVLYAGIRTGRHNTRFRMLKFRTMPPGSDAGWRTTGLNDPRVTRVGAILRRYKLDELPQLWNVLEGTMSIVGPRPELPYYTDQYEGDERLILTVRPGITDISSLQFRNLSEVVGSSDVNRAFEEKVLPKKNRLRVEYVRRRSFTLDIRLILQTITAIFTR